MSSLARETQDADLEALFAPFGTLVQAQVMRDPHSQEPRGFGFVTFAEVDDAAKAVEALNGHVLHDRAISVQVARRARARVPTPGQYLGPPKRRDGPPRRDRPYDRDRGYGGRERGGYDRPRYDRAPRRDASPGRAPRTYDREAPADA